MKIYAYVALAVLSFYLSACFGSGSTPQFDSDKNPPSYTIWDTLLKKYVTESGGVDYTGFQDEKDKLDTFLELLSSNPPGDHWTREEKLTYWINAYNAFTVKLICDHYPVGSIKDIGPAISIPAVNDVFELKYFTIGNKEMSLNIIEHDILRKMDEPRIHFAINCASVSCPRLRNETYTADKLEAQLQDQTLFYINSSGENHITSGRAELAKIFRWFKGDFTQDGSLADFINQYSAIPIDENTDISYRSYNWQLNALKNMR